MLLNLDDDEDKSPQRGDRRTRIRAIGVAPFAFVGFFAGLFLSASRWGSGHTVASLLVTLAGAVGGGFLGVFVQRFLPRAWRALRDLIAQSGRKQAPAPQQAGIEMPGQPTPVSVDTPTAEPAQAVGVSKGPTQGERKLYGRVALVCGGVGALFLLALVGGLLPATFASVVFVILTLGGGAWSYVLSRRGPERPR